MVKKDRVKVAKLFRKLGCDFALSHKVARTFRGNFKTFSPFFLNGDVRKILPDDIQIDIIGHDDWDDLRGIHDYFVDDVILTSSTGISISWKKVWNILNL